MTKDEAVAQIKLLLGFREDQATLIAAQIDLQQRILERSNKFIITPWFLQTERSDSTLVPNDERLAYPEDYIIDIEDDALVVIDSDANEHQLEKSDEDYLRQLYPNGSYSLPAAYSQDGLYYRLFPAPDLAYTVRMRYYALDALATSDGTNKWLTHYPEALIGYVGLMLAGAGNNPRRDLFSAMWLSAKEAIDKKSIELQTVNRRYYMGETA